MPLPDNAKPNIVLPPAEHNGKIDIVLAEACALLVLSAKRLDDFPLT